VATTNNSAASARPKPLNPWQPTTDRLQLAVLGKLGEELGEASSAANRCIIQGIDEREPTTDKLNREWLLEEISDVLGTVEVAIRHFELDRDLIGDRTEKKIDHLLRWHALIGHAEI
jgi:hypothetical protein